MTGPPTFRWASRVGHILSTLAHFVPKHLNQFGLYTRRRIEDVGGHVFSIFHCSWAQRRSMLWWIQALGSAVLAPEAVEQFEVKLSEERVKQLEVSSFQRNLSMPMPLEPLSLKYGTCSRK
eukprot:GHVN01010712.1.p1 GENE.GHVN01010712.1~~GHVN01010712.1.p1  ORF type:complete len:121 (-),score=6.64 GHVN01010712.1:833-1195(-)